MTVPAGRTVPGLLLWPTTLPVVALVPFLFLTLPTLQSASLIVALESLSVLPASFGTVQVFTEAEIGAGVASGIAVGFEAVGAW